MFPFDFLWLQNLEGNVTHSLACPEFCHLVRTWLLPCIKQAYKKKPEAFNFNIKNARIFLDNARPHTAAVARGIMEEVGLSRDCVRWAASCSHDLNAPIEWAHGLAKCALGDYLYSHPDEGQNPQAVKRLFQSMWQQHITPEYVGTCVAKMPQVYKDILAANGGWASRSI